MTTDPGIRLTRAEAVQRVTAEHLEQVLHPQFAGSGQQVLTKGLGASPGAAVGRVYLTADDAAAAAEQGERVILVRSETSPEDVHGMLAAQGILTARGGLVSHAAVVARGWGKPAVVGAEKVRIAGRSFTVGATVVHEGDWISIDGTAGEVVLGQVELAEAKASEEFETLLGWADVIRKGHLKVRANADNGPDAANGRRMGAEGIGLCRTEHMFIAEDRLPIVRRMILAEDAAAEDAALEELRVAQRADFIEILEAMDGLPVTVRLLDPPLHEFLPDTGELAIKEATVGLDRRGAGAVRGGQAVARVQPHAGHPGRAPRRHQARPLRHAGAGAHGGGRPTRGRRRQARHRDHDPAHGHPRGAGAGEELGGRGRHRHAGGGRIARFGASSRSSSAR